MVRPCGRIKRRSGLDEITSDAVLFKDGAGTCVPVEQLSDGFRSVLSMTFEMLRGMVMAYGSETVLRTLETTAIRLPGVVAVDEIDSHLHPTWQKRIGDWLTGRFPDVQFLVTTHSPIICQSAAQGSIWRLPTPGSDEEPHQIEGKDKDRLVYGSILDALDTEYFGSDVTRSDAFYDMMKELAMQGVRVDELRLRMWTRGHIRHVAGDSGIPRWSLLRYTDPQRRRRRQPWGHSRGFASSNWPASDRGRSAG